MANLAPVFKDLAESRGQHVDERPLSLLSTEFATLARGRRMSPEDGGQKHRLYSFPVTFPER